MFARWAPLLSEAEAAELQGNVLAMSVLSKADATCQRLESDITAARQDGDALLQAVETRFQEAWTEMESLRNQLSQCRAREARTGENRCRDLPCEASPMSFVFRRIAACCLRVIVGVIPV
jgi:hypothetical protein